MPRDGVLLINLGTPDAPTPAALRRYLKEFLLDNRVVERTGLFSRFFWRLVLHGFILPWRAPRSAAKYALIWGEDSPLREHTRLQAEALQETLAARGSKTSVFWAMRYGKPAVAEVLDEMAAEGIDRLLVLPLYPQYSASTTASALDAVCAWFSSCRNQPQLRVIRSFPTHPAYLAALEDSIRSYWAEHGALPQDGRLVLSFHGMPEKSRTLGDPYYDECLETARLLGARLGLEEGVCRVGFQSRFGRAEWLKPDTFAVLGELAAEGVGRVDVFCPGFAADCLETLEEIAMGGKSVFLQAAKKEGAQFNYIPALNERKSWIEALADLSCGRQL